jgi:hypothetical protein
VRSASDIALAECTYTAAALCSSTDRLRDERSLAPPGEDDFIHNKRLVGFVLQY